ncbi:thiamine pyrophosphate-dependent dehydrogenase E1 component subunit alpha [Methylovirgula sp. HY1]|uniref:thiamine pyrophosphate-dependent dehydrogenase E1 component subunit alpha n=1 Tax=Methylovirgula sp. HY1 TaxID=2822761 RepID=UPI001C5A75F3|nr:thiamine pyrophosphate-dependent enzyme [Methylovirgula sp. HY1]QXX76640.1 Acetoin:2,6-dichlorophenolindophenol oxidoreductase subunit alpha [Methylovirgula sp. HY1]
MERETLHRLLHDMLLARAFEERAAEEYTKGNIVGFLHLYPGEEAVAAGVINAAGPSDYIVSTYREHAHALVRGVPPGKVMAELFGRADGMSGGMGGSMHMFDRERRFMGGYAIVGESCPIGVGIAYAIAMRNLPEAVICFFGDGAMNQGAFHEALNMAGLWHLPILFVCENNHYAIGTEVHRHSALSDLYKRAAAYNIPAERIDGMDVLSVYDTTRHTLDRIRRGGGPQFIECETYRYRGHSMADPGSYRPAVELKAFQAHDPVSAAIRDLEFSYPSREELAAIGPDSVGRLAKHLIDSGHVREAEVEALKAQVQKAVDDAAAYALASPQPTMEAAWQALNCNRGHEVLI